MNASLSTNPLVTELRSWIGFPKKELDVLLEQAADEIERLEAAVEPEAEPEGDPPVYDIEFALNIARLWRANKMIGGDQDAVRDALLTEVERLRGEVKSTS